MISGVSTRSMERGNSPDIRAIAVISGLSPRSMFNNTPISHNRSTSGLSTGARQQPRGQSDRCDIGVLLNMERGNSPEVHNRLLGCRLALCLITQPSGQSDRCDIWAVDSLHV